MRYPHLHNMYSYILRHIIIMLVCVIHLSRALYFIPVSSFHPFLKEVILSGMNVGLSNPSPQDARNSDLSLSLVKL